MEITWEHIVLFITALGVIVTAVNQRIAAKRASDIQEASTVITGYDKLTKSLAMRIDKNEQRIKQLEKELAESRAENALLRKEIEELRQENVELKQELAELKQSRVD